MSSTRSFRLETRSRARDEIRKIVQTVDKVRKWEKKWVDLGLSNSIKVYKWVPVREETKEEEEDKENEPLELPQNEASLSIGIMSTSSLVQELRPSESLPSNILDDESETNRLVDLNPTPPTATPPLSDQAQQPASKQLDSTPLNQPTITNITQQEHIQSNPGSDRPRSRSRSPIRTS